MIHSGVKVKSRAKEGCYIKKENSKFNYRKMDCSIRRNIEGRTYRPNEDEKETGKNMFWEQMNGDLNGVIRTRDEESGNVIDMLGEMKTTEK